MQKITRLVRWLRKKRTKRLAYTIFIKCGGAVAIIIIIWFFIHTPLVSVRYVTIAVNTNNEIITKKIETLIYEKFNEKRFIIVGGRTYYLFNRDEIIEHITKKIPQIASVTIDPEFLNNWQVTIQEREKFASYCIQKDECFVIDTMGVPFFISSVNQLRMIETDLTPILLEPILPTEIFGKITQVVQFLEYRGVYISRIAVAESDQVVLETELGLEIRFSTNQTIYETTRSLYIALFKIFNEDNEIQLEYLDVRLPNTIYYLDA